MTDEQALLAAIWEYPHDDTPRLVYADWLEETGNPVRVARAEFIRVQCELARLEKVDPMRPILEQRERLLWQRFKKAFRQELPDPIRGCPFRRGFVAPAFQSLPTHKLFNRYWDILPLAPLWEIGVRDASDAELHRLVTSELLQRFGSLTLSGGGAAFERFVEFTHTLNITLLDWNGASATPNLIRRFAALGRFPHLNRLILTCTDIGDEGGMALGESVFAPQLVELRIMTDDLGPDGIKGLFEPQQFERLSRLDLGYNGYPAGDNLILPLTVHARIPTLRFLRLRGMFLSTASAESLASWSGGISLQYLDLSKNYDLRATDVRLITESPHLANLRTLDISPTRSDQVEITRILTERFGRAYPTPNDQLTLRGGDPV